MSSSSGLLKGTGKGKTEGSSRITISGKFWSQQKWRRHCFWEARAGMCFGNGMMRKS